MGTGQGLKPALILRNLRRELTRALIQNFLPNEFFRSLRRPALHPFGSFLNVNGRALPCTRKAKHARFREPRSEGELAADLELPRRSAIADREAGPADLAEGRGLHVPRRLAKVGVVKNVERIHAQVEGEVLA